MLINGMDIDPEDDYPESCEVRVNIGECMEDCGEPLPCPYHDKPSTPPAPSPSAPTVDAILSQLEDEMHHHLDQPVTGDFMSLTRGWREILEQRPPSPSAPTMTPELVTKLAAECDRVAAQWEPVAECIAEAKAALANCNPPHSPESDPSGLYYPLLFLVKRLEEYDNAE